MPYDPGKFDNTKCVGILDDNKKDETHYDNYVEIVFSREEAERLLEDMGISDEMNEKTLSDATGVLRNAEQLG